MHVAEKRRVLMVNATGAQSTDAPSGLWSRESQTR
jgi:hypothetical protein